LKLLLFSDLHLDRAFRWAGERTARKRRQALRDTLLQITRLAAEEKVDALLCGGDLYEHERFSADTGEFLRSTFERLHPIRVFIAPGNHDWYGPESLYRQVSWSPNVHVFSSDRLEPVELENGLILWGAAHRAPANTDGFLERFPGSGRQGVNLALFHGSEVNSLPTQEQGKIPHAPFKAPDIERCGLSHAFLGHFHSPRLADRFTYPGNPDPLDFGEQGNRGAVLAMVGGDGTVSREYRNVATSVVHDIDLDVTGCGSQQDVRDLLLAQLLDLTGSVRVTLNGELRREAELLLPDLQELGPHLDGLVVRTGALHVSYDLASIVAQATVAGEFVREVTAADIPAEIRSRILITGLRALDGRTDLEGL
jgi:DNA repair protein SbcD/Mre11